MPRKVLVFAGHFFPHVGGVERYTRELWGRLARRGFEIALLTGNTNAAPAEESVDGIAVTRVPVAQVLHGRLPILLPSRALLRAEQRFRSWRPHAIVTNTRFFSTSILGVALARRWGIPSLHIDHGSEHIPIPVRPLNAIGEAFDHVAGGWVVRRATRCVGVSASVASFMGHLGRADAGVLYNGVDSRLVAPRDPALRERLGVPPGASMVLYVGRVIEDKGVGVLLDAFERVGPPRGAHLVIAGDGPMMPTLRKRVGTRPDVRLLGFVSGEEVRSLLAATDVFAHPSAYPEGLPTSVLEAGAAGAAVVATPMGGTVEVISSPSEGLLVEPRSVDALAGALERLLDDEPGRRAMGAALQRRVQAVFDWERVADAAEHELAALIGATDRRD